MNIIRLYSMLVLLCLFFAVQQMNAQCDMTLSAVVTHINCFGEEGTIDLTVANGTAPYEFAWSDGQTDEDAIGLSAGLYIVTVTDALGCVKNLARNITGPSSALSLVLNDDGIITCQNPASNITTTVGGGIAPYNYLWSTGVTTNVLAADSAGVYTVTITDANSCTITNSKTVLVDPSYPVADAGPIEVIISCATAPNILGGPGTSIGPDFVYHWRNFVWGIDPGVDINQPFIEVTSPGFYEFEVTNIVEGCTSSDLIYVNTDFSFPVITTQVPPPLTCMVTEVSLNAVGSSVGPQYIAQWTTSNGHIVSGANTLFPVVDEPGDYILTITNHQVGCTKKGLVTVVEGQGTLIANAGPDTGIPCGGNQVTLDGSGSSSGVQFTYNWTTLDGNFLAGANTLNPIVNQPGTYTLVVTETQTGCTKMDEVRVFPGPVIPQADFSTLDVSCTGQLGVASVGMTLGSGPYTYLWSNGSTQQAIINIFQGTYTVTVTDVTGCDYYGVTEIKDTSTLTLSAQTMLPSCIPGNDGAIDVTATSVFGPFEYAWNAGETTQDLSNLTAGTYTVTVTYALGTCTQTLSVTLSDSSSLTLSMVATNAPCSGACSGSIDLTVSGGVAPFQYFWSPGNTTQDISFLCPATYTVTVSDANSCTKTASAVIAIQTSNIVLTAIPTDASCNMNNGSIDLTVTGGAPQYQFAWSDGGVVQDRVALIPGTYTVTVTDANGCTQTASATVGQTFGLTLSAVVAASTSCSFSNGTIDLTVAPGGSYTYIWMNGSVTQDLSNISAGTYTVTGSAGGNCTAVDSYIVPDLPNLPIPTAISTPTICDLSNGSIDASVTAGVAPYNYLWSTGATSEDLSNIVAGFYDLTVTGANGCTNTITTDVVNNNQPITVNGTVTPNTVCVGNPNGSVDITVAPLGTYTYTWSNAATTKNLNGLPPGQYTVTVSGGGSCTQTNSFDVPDNSNTPTIASAITNASCNGNDGVIDLSITGGVSPYTVDWFNIPGANNPEDLSNLSAGTYTCTVTDVAGCSQVAIVTVGQLSDLAVSVVKNDVSCFGSATVLLTLQ